MIRLAVVGNPLSHSLSPVLHQHLLEQIGLEGKYEKRQVEANALLPTLQEMKHEGYLGFNVTIPFKQSILVHLDQVEDAARRINAVNTVRIAGKMCSGINTDASGFVRALEYRGVEIEQASAVVLGAGGAARAVVFSLIHNGIAELTLLSRTLSTASALVHEVQQRLEFDAIQVKAWADAEISRQARSSQILINTTPVGMWPHVDSSPFAFDFDARGLTVVDLVYNPLTTRFLQAARAAGARTVDGLDMFIFQGVEALQFWLQEILDFDYRELRTFLIEKLAAYGKR
ncbi:MAG: shikimate dehydrogenase [bacterium]